jgi:dTDP-4-dehydrorhamnose reductase
MKVLVTGSKGQLGSELQKLADVYEDIEFSFFDLPDFDINNETDIDFHFDSIKPDYVVNCAAYTNVDKAESEREQAFQVNAEAVGKLGEGCRTKGIRLIHISTDYVFSGLGNTPYKESDAPDPLSVYGESKLLGEKYLADNKFAMTIRTSWLYSSSGNSFVHKIFTKSKQSDQLRVVYDQVGSPTHAADLADAIITICLQSHKNTGTFSSGIFHYTNEGVASWFDFAIEILRYFGSETVVIPIESHEFNTAVKRPHYSVLAKNRIKTLYSINIPHWRQSLGKCIEEIKNKNNTISHG